MKNYREIRQKLRSHTGELDVIARQTWQAEMGRMSRHFMWCAAYVFLCASLAYSTTQTYEIVPPSWISPDGMPEHQGKSDSKESGIAYIFPSIPDAAPDSSGPGVAKSEPADPSSPTVATLKGFFRPHTHFRQFTFQWPHREAPELTLVVERQGDDAVVTMMPVSERALRKLSWERFENLQASYLDRLLDHTNCNWFGSCDNRFNDINPQLISMWKILLSHATLSNFARDRLNLFGPRPLSYSGTIANVGRLQTAMFVTPLSPGQQIAVTWGNENYYPFGNQIQAGYSRIGSGGVTELRVIGNQDRMQLASLGSCNMDAVPQQGSVPADGLFTALPKEWAAMVSHEFLPVYNRFDLSNAKLLTHSNAPAGCADRSAPKYLYLLQPATYIKADPDDRDGDRSKFENEARSLFPGDPTVDFTLLAREFLIIGCDDGKPEALEGEWNYLLDRAYSLSNMMPTPGSRTCGPYVNALFSGKSFVEVRNSFSINGHPLDSGRSSLETVGQAFAAGFATRVDREGRSGTPPLLEVLRAPDRLSQVNTGATAIRLRFHTTVSSILDQVYVFQGDEIRAGFIPEDLQ